VVLIFAPNLEAGNEPAGIPSVALPCHSIMPGHSRP
jgi:hypothetical protein